MQPTGEIRESRPGVRVLTRKILAVAVATVAIVLGGCDEGAPSLSAEATDADQREVCIRVEDQETWGRLDGCYPPPEEVRLEVGDCIRTRVPSPDVPEERGKPLRDVELLDRACDA